MLLSSWALFINPRSLPEMSLAVGVAYVTGPVGLRLIIEFDMRGSIVALGVAEAPVYSFRITVAMF
ncbi:hypothetical protein MAR_030535 [Mya arenaria]|uniref:Uncharacterized protein n=1 Tax=Mya arenaria TaxID=6604 RepID=A0ABY7F9F8_MYAAR|nr:hypothetical protein MAR_030535 [Mya arenaria]